MSGDQAQLARKNLMDIQPSEDGLVRIMIEPMMIKTCLMILIGHVIRKITPK